SPGVIEGSIPTDEAMEDIIREIPAGRIGTPEDVAGVVSFLVSREADYVTGADVVVSGGWQV
ncbi:MAG: SDR family oxidoreductase, partial [Deltaproteobacteria bacterium]|nr:SDR family oxidoreductase [Deltaproteobacteria bacterium]